MNVCREGYRRCFVLLGLVTYSCYICVYAGTEGATRIYFAENKYGGQT